MKTYIFRRLLLFIPVIVIFSVVLFTMLHAIPGDIIDVALGGNPESGSFSQETIDRLRQEYGLNKPLYRQYGEWVGDIFTKGELGKSLRSGKDTWDIIQDKFPLTMELAIMGIAFAYIFSIPAGILMAVKQDSPFDYVLRLFTITGLAMPAFWMGILVILILSKGFGWLPPLGYRNFFEDPARNLVQLVFPAVVIGLHSMSLASRVIRSSMLEVLRQDYVRTATAKGLSRLTVINRHAFRNALIPIVTLLGLQIAHAVGGAVIIEQLFNLPGLGRQLVDSVHNRDYTVIQGMIMFITVWVLLANLAIDMLYGWMDPRIRYT